MQESRRQDRYDLIQMFRITHQLFPGCIDDLLEFALDQRLRAITITPKKNLLKVRTVFVNKSNIYLVERTLF
jgi:hypothetical protein